jgi:hypothetical protein
MGGFVLCQDHSLGGTFRAHRDGEVEGEGFPDYTLTMMLSGPLYGNGFVQYDKDGQCGADGRVVCKAMMYDKPGRGFLFGSETMHRTATGIDEFLMGKDAVFKVTFFFFDPRVTTRRTSTGPYARKPG